MLWTFEFCWFFSWANDFRKNITKNNIKWFTRSCSLICRSSVFTKKTYVLTEICCFVSIYLLTSCLALVACNKTNIPFLFCFISKLFSLSNYGIQLRFVSLNINYFGWIISDIKQKCMEYLLNNARGNVR